MANYYLRLSANKKHWEIGELVPAKAPIWQPKERARKHGKPIVRYPIGQQAEAMAHYQSLIKPIPLNPKPRAIAINRRGHTGA
ncbi:hypothetical protein L1281_002521 [Neisseria sp. HSC-16F19]|nr:hypothetical protein [Neisseria sp. HSC-16F19]MCP2041903.1 hypothetical protein [Neisseria sp. HSC-16F19]